MKKNTVLLSNLRKAFLSLALFLAPFLQSKAAVAQAIYTLEGTYCQPERGDDPGGKDDQAYIKYQELNGYWAVTNINSTQTANVHCPITKYTSAPGTHSDALTNVSVTFAASAQTSTCQVNVWLMSASFSSWGANPPSNEEQQHAMIPAAGGTESVYVANGGSITDFWDGDGDGASWFYAELVCQLSPGASLEAFTVDEAGPKTNRLMFPASMCTQYYNQASFDYNGSTGGYLVTSDNGGGFQFQCPLFPNGYENVQIMVGPSISSPTNDPYLACYLENQENTTWVVVPQNVHVPHDFPADILTFTRGSNNYSNGGVVCGMWQGNGSPGNGSLVATGDGKIYSYRMW